MTARLIFLHCLIAITVVVTFNLAALSSAEAPGSALARTIRIMAQGRDDDSRTSSWARRAGILLETPGFRRRLDSIFHAFGLGHLYRDFFLVHLTAIRDGRSGDVRRTLNDLQPEVILEVAEFVAGRHRGALRERTREYLVRISALNKALVEHITQSDYRVAFVKYYRDRYLGSWLNDIYRDVLFSGRRRVGARPERALTDFLAAYRDKLHLLVHASDTQLYRIFQLELVAAIEGRSAPGEKCRKSSLLWAGRTLRPAVPLFWDRTAYDRANYTWDEHDFRSEVQKLDILMSIARHGADQTESNIEQFRNRFEIIKYREERAIRKKLGIPYKFGVYGKSNDGNEYPFKPYLRFPGNWKIRENYCDLLYASLAYRHNLERRELLLYMRELLRQRQEVIRQQIETSFW